MLLVRNLKRKQCKYFVTQIKKISTGFIEENNNHEKIWATAKSYKSLPGPSTTHLIKCFAPGGKYNSMRFSEIHEHFVKEFGPIYKVPGIFGRRDIVVIIDPKDFEIVFRTEGTRPIRRGLECLAYYRKHYKKDLYATSLGLTNDQEEAWWNFRQKVNGVMLKPQVIKGYTTAIDEVSSDFVKRLHNLRDSNSETPPNLFFHLNTYALEAIAYITTNLRLGLLSESRDKSIDELMDNIKTFFYLLDELDIKPSMWRIYKTKKFKQFVRVLDKLHEDIEVFVNRGLEKLKEEKTTTTHICVLEKLYEIDKNIAIIMVFDSLLAGVDTTSAGAFSILYNLAKNPEKQKTLRSELFKILPEKNSPLTAENLNNTPYLKACFKESLRIMPVVAANFRATGRNIVLKGYQIPKQTDVLMHNALTHMDEKYFPESHSFVPERWLRSSQKYDNYNPFTYLPFGYGSRICIGRRFAELEIRTLAARLVRNYHLEWNYPPPTIESLTINMPQGDLRLCLKDFN